MFKEFLARVGLTATKLQEMFGVSHVLTNRMREKGPTMIERYAMSAIAAGLQPWSPENAHEADAVRPVIDAIREATAARDDAENGKAA